MKVCSVCGRALEGDGTMNRQQYTHPTDTVAACVNGEWKPITPQQLADELAALRECVRAADGYFEADANACLPIEREHIEEQIEECHRWRMVAEERRTAYYAARAKVTPQ